MINRKIIAQNITNLTDARYFAAWGVDYISFNIINDSEFKISKEKIKEIKDWVEGPKCLIETNALDIEDLADGYILSNIYSTMPISQEAFYKVHLDDVSKGLPSGKYILKLNDEADLDNLLKVDESHLQGIELYLDISQIDLKHFSKLKHFPIVIQGGEEEKIGVKSFDDLDELYDLLIEEEP